MTECPCSKLVELVQRLLRDTETCVAAVPSLMPPSDIRAVLCVVRSTLGEPALFLYSLSPGSRGLALRDVLPLSTHALTLTATASNSAGSGGSSAASSASSTGGNRNTAVTVVVQRRKDGAKLVFETLVTPDADRRAQLATFAGMAETAARDIVVTEDTFGWVLRYKLSLPQLPLAPVSPLAHNVCAHSLTRNTENTTVQLEDPEPETATPQEGTATKAAAAAGTAAGDAGESGGSLPAKGGDEGAWDGAGAEGLRTETKEVTIMFATWNVNGKLPPASLEEWLVRAGGQGVSPDIYCIGFQELDLSASALVLGDTSKAEPWESCIAATLSKHGDYVKLATKLLVGIFLCVFVRRDVLRCVSDVQSDLMPVGILGVMGNKGGVAIRFALNDSTFCVVNSHLNAHMENVARRNQDYHDIARELVFFVDGRRTSIWDHDLLFWIGDLNYRIMGADADVRSRLRRGDIASLLPLDQLRQQQAARLAFEPFAEPPITFQPTYKYDANSTEYDTSQTHRCPAWCDRILYHVGTSTSSSSSSSSTSNNPSRNNSPTPAAATSTEGEEKRDAGDAAEKWVTNVDYVRHELLISDHRPVSALYRVRTRTGLAEAKKKMMRHRLREMDNFENESIPEVAFSASELAFGQVHYNETVPRKLGLKNTGTVVANWRFEKKPGERSACKPWVRVVPSSGSLAPGEQVTLLVTAGVDRNVAPLLSGSAGNALDDILVLHIQGGKDYFLALTGEYVRSSLGMTVPQLVAFDHPVRTSLPAGERRLWVPKEIWRLVDHLMLRTSDGNGDGNGTRCGLDTPGLFAPNAPNANATAPQPAAADLDVVQECLDTGESLALHDVAPQTAAAALLRLLDNLGMPIVSADLYPRLMQCTSLAEAKALLGSQLDDENYTTFFYILSFLRTVLAHAHNNGTTAEQLAAVFAPVLLRSPRAVIGSFTGQQTDPASTTAEQREAATFVYRFLSDISPTAPH